MVPLRCKFLKTSISFHPHFSPAVFISILSIILSYCNFFCHSMFLSIHLSLLLSSFLVFFRSRLMMWNVFHSLMLVSVSHCAFTCSVIKCLCGNSSFLHYLKRKPFGDRCLKRSNQLHFFRPPSRHPIWLSQSHLRTYLLLNPSFT